MNTDNRIAVSACREYDRGAINEIIRVQLGSLGFDPGRFRGKKVLIKPNLVIRYDPSKAATVHPYLIEAAAKIFAEAGAEVIIAESPGGLYTESTLRSLYKVTGAADAAENAGAALNYSVAYSTVSAPDGLASKEFNIIDPARDADCIIGISKLKTHSLSVMTAAVKNYFGVIPGVQKFELHARFKDDRESFFTALDDLCELLCSTKEVFSIVDAVVGMEGNGPSGGNPREIGCILSGMNPFALDLACASLINADPPMLSDAVKRGFCPDSAEKLEVLGDRLSDFTVPDFAAADSGLSRKFNYIPDFLKPRPAIDPSVCVGCGECAGNCPAKAISLIKKNGKRHAKISDGKCIRCYCCQELCTFKAVRIKKNVIYKLIT